MEHQGSQNNNPTGIWQSKWAQKIDDILYHFSTFSTMAAWNDLIDFKTILPPDCEEDIKQLFEETEKIVFKKYSVSTVSFYAEKTRLYHREYVVLPAERKLLTAIKNSLFDRGWINKDFSIHPRQGTATIRCPE
jgi:hypothetical protein